MSDNPSKSTPKSSTERGRDFRARRREEGGTTTAMMLTPRGRASLEIIKSVHKSSKVESVEVALFNEAHRLCPTEADVQRLITRGVLTKKIGKVWLLELKAAKAAVANKATPIP